MRSSDPEVGGDFMTPTFAAGDVLTEQDDGTGFENADDATPGLDGSCILLDISLAEASVPAILEGRRLYRFVDQTSPNAWIPREIQIVTTDHPLAAEPNGVVAQGLGDAVGQTTTALVFTLDIGVRAGYFFIVTAGTGSGQAGYVNAYANGDPFVVTPEQALDTALDDTSVVKFYIDRPYWLNATTTQSTVEAGSRVVRNEMLAVGIVDAGSSTTEIIVKSITPTYGVNDQYKGGIIKFSKTTTTAALRNVSARIISGGTAAGQELPLNPADELPATPAEDDEFWVL